MHDTIYRASSPRAILRAVLLVAAVLSLHHCAAFAQSDKVRQAEREIRSRKSVLEQIEEEIAEVNEQARGLQKREQGLARQIQQIERDIDDSRKNLRALNSEIEEINSELSYINRQLVRVSENLEQKKRILHRRLREIYKRGRLHTFQVLLGSHSFTDFIKRMKYLTLIATQDKRLVEEVGQLRHSYSQYRSASERKLAQRLERRNRLELEQRKLESSEKERQKMLRSVRSQRAEVLKALEQRKQDREQMKRIIAELERRRKEAIEQARREGRAPGPETAYLEGKMGSLDWPVKRGRLVRRFGPYVDKITKTKVINNGIDIQARLGTEVHSVGGGSVIMADFFRSYGKMVMVNHGSGMYTIYGHLSDIYVREGDFVREGQVIAAVGATGSLDGPMLYFELRDGARAVDPLTWLGKM